MKCLFIDTSTSNATIAVIINNEITYIYNEEIKNDMSSKIIPLIDDGMKKSNINIKDIDKIFVVNGPGSFTGVRIGVTIAKTIAWGLKIDVIPISSLEFISTTNTNKKFIIPMIDARRNNVFGAIYDNDLNIIKEDRLINIEELLFGIDENYELVSYDITRDNVVKPSPNILKIIEKHKLDKSINPHSLKPNYLKLTEAEESKLNHD